MSQPSLYRAALAELAAVCDALDDAAVDEAVARVAAARRIVVLGCGRERLQIMGFAMRLFHMGLGAAVAGEMTAPAVGPGDLLMVTSGPGTLASVDALMRVARAAGAAVLLVTSEPGSATAQLADFILVLRAQTMASGRPGLGAPAAASILPMGSAYEGALFVLFEVMVLKLRARLGISVEEMSGNHTNLE